MKITKYLYGLGIMAAMSLSACSNDEPSVMVPETEGNESFFATLTLSLPTANGSRSETITPGDNGNSSDGTLDGEAYESNIKSILVVLATLENGEYTLQTVNQGDANPNGGTAATPNYTIKFNNQVVFELAEKNVYPFVICNPDAKMIAKFAALPRGNTSFVNDIVTLTDANDYSGWLKNNFLMTNAYIDETKTAVLMPTAAELKQHTSSNNPYNITQKSGAIKVERVVARFDFKSTQKDGLGINTYEIKTAASATPTTVGYVTITGMALINQAQDFYTFRRVSDTGTSTDWTIGGLETPLNYMVSPSSDDLTARNFMLQGFNSGNAVAPATLSYTSIAGMSATDYTIWRYTTENAIPGTTNQKKGITTGVVFKGKMTFKDGSDLANVAATGKPIYKFGNTLYGGFNDLVNEIKNNPNTLLAYNALQAGLYSGIDASGNLENLCEESQINQASGVDLSKWGFTVYRADANGDYNMYYYYWNRHNDNLDNNSMGIMEFGVVRNNVYRLAVNNIYNFGHPGDPSDDDTPEDPNDPDETIDLYISLDVQVLPWTVRVNNIEF